jgi:hypothetical protein
MKSLTATAAAFVASAIALSFPATASAVPEWDIGMYDQCVGSFDGDPLDSPAEHQRWSDHMKDCCEKTGGIFKYAGAGGCVAPPAEQTHKTVQGTAPVKVFEPASPWTTRVPGGVVLQPLTPAP